ncbi:MAG: hypothetical protein JO338_07250 [Aquitalea sp.]|nr:hypothetical protein [Aquitalea sp.]
MKHRLLLVLLALGATAPALAANVGISVNIGEPGFYGQLDIGNYPAPPVLYPQPVIVSPVVVAQPPIYLRVPPGHARHWDRYCGRYHACDKRVFFVQDQWYRQEYGPRYLHDHDHRPDHGREHGDWHGDQHGDDHRHDQRHDQHDNRWPQQDEYHH